jgi:hypothetical protein
LKEGALPASWDDPFTVVQDTVSLLESALGDEVAVEEHVEGFHDLDIVMNMNLSVRDVQY